MAELCQREKTILALGGGGAVLREANREWLAKCPIGRSWLLRALGGGDCYKRMEGDPTTAARRPNLTNRGGLTRNRAVIGRA